MDNIPQKTPAKMEEIKYNNHIIRKFTHEDGFEYYYAEDVAAAIGIKKVRITVKNYNETEIVFPDRRKKYNIITYRRYKDSFRRDDRMILITNQGLMRLLSSSRMSDSIELANFFNINTYNHKFTPIETSTLKIIQEAFSGEPMTTQHQVGNYRIDLYLSARKIAIECDERNHSDRDPEHEINRENVIKKELNCEFIRYNPNASNFNIISVINQVYKKIINCS